MRTIKFQRRRFNRYQREAFSLSLFFANKGFKTYWVGGAVRDFLLGRDNYDIDLATAAKPSEVKKLLQEAKIESYPVGEKFGTIGALVPGGKVEITTFREERGYEDYRHPSRVTYLEGPEKDVLRRDFTINALLLDPKAGTILDYVGGLEDLKKKTLRFVGEPKERIQEDPLRMLRAVRFATILNFKINPKDFEAIKKNAVLIQKTSGERIKVELDKIMGDPNFIFGIQLLEQAGLLRYILPEVDNLKKVEQSEDFHAEGDAFIHTLQVLKNLKGAGLVLRYAAFFHDLGKAKTGQKKLRAGREHISFFGHASEGARMFSGIAKRLRFTRKEKDVIGYLITHHMDLLHPDQISKNTLIKWAKNEYFPDLVRLRIADTLGSKRTDLKGGVPKKDIRPLLGFLRFAIKAKPVYEKELLNGNEVMQLLKIRQGKKVGLVLKKLKDAQVKGLVKTKKQAEKFVKTLDNKI